MEDVAVLVVELQTCVGSRTDISKPQTAVTSGIAERSGGAREGEPSTAPPSGADPADCGENPEVAAGGSGFLIKNVPGYYKDYQALDKGIQGGLEKRKEVMIGRITALMGPITIASFRITIVTGGK